MDKKIFALVLTLLLISPINASVLENSRVLDDVYQNYTITPFHYRYIYYSTFENNDTLPMGLGLYDSDSSFTNGTLYIRLKEDYITGITNIGTYLIDESVNINSTGTGVFYNLQIHPQATLTLFTNLTDGNISVIQNRIVTPLYSSIQTKVSLDALSSALVVIVNWYITLLSYLTPIFNLFLLLWDYLIKWWIMLEVILFVVRRAIVLGTNYNTGGTGR
jgi:hypothetical protein